MRTAVYLEEHRPGDAEGSRPLPWWPGVEQGEVEETPLIREGVDAGASALLRRLRASRLLATMLRRRTGESALAMLVRLVEESWTPVLAREIWRGIVGLRVLDPACGDGRWLLGCLEALATVALSCLERMQGWVEADDGGPLVRPPAGYPDFRRLLRRRRELAALGGTERLAYETVLLRCLHGVTEDLSGAEEARRRLANRVPRLTASSEPGLAEALIDVRVGFFSRAGALRQARSSASTGDARTGIARAVEERATALGRAYEQLVRLRLELGGTLEELADGRAEISRRRRQMHAVLAAARGTGEVIPLHPLLEYPRIVDRGGFDLVRRTPSDPVAWKARRHAC